MNKRILVVAALLGALSGCVSTQFAAVSAGPVVMGNLNVNATDGMWNKAPDVMTGHLHKGSELWTRDGTLLDQLLVLPGISNGGTLFKSNNKALVYPEYKNNMLPNEIVELTEASLAKLMGTNILVESGGLRPHRLGEQRAVMFDLTLTGAEAPRRQGRALAFVNNEQLYVMIYVATQIHYFDKHWDAALRLMESARVSGQA
ncbi:MAG: hypothetical protein AAF513_18935 [Pseudomonadota bacterium]